MKRLLIAAVLAALPVPASAQAPYRALGTEPFWSVTIGGGRMVYEDPEGGRVVVRTPAARPSFNGRRYVTRRLTVDITRQACSDGMSDRDYADTVRVTVDGRELSGCGGAIFAPATLAHSAWRIVSIDGADVSRQDGYQIDFDENRFSGRAGCNAFNAAYRVSSDGFQAGLLAMTRMACPGTRMRHEQAVARILAGRVRLFYPDGATLIMRSPAGELRLQRLG